MEYNQKLDIERKRPPRGDVEERRSFQAGVSGGPQTVYDNTSTVNQKLPKNYVVEYPMFLKPSKYYPYRRLEDAHVEETMNSALQRYENELVVM